MKKKKGKKRHVQGDTGNSSYGDTMMTSSEEKGENEVRKFVEV